MVAPNHDPFSEHHGPPLFIETNRTRAIEDVRTIYIYVAFVALYTAFLIIFPGIRRDKLTTFVSVTTSIIVGAIISDASIGTKWQIGHALIDSPYRAFSKDRIRADLRVNIGLHSVNITLKATAFITSAHSWSHRHNTHQNHNHIHQSSSSSLTPSSINLKSSDSNYDDSTFLVDIRPSISSNTTAQSLNLGFGNSKTTTATTINYDDQRLLHQEHLGDINYNERFYWIGPTDMKQEFHNALVRGLPFPILTVAEYLSQDEAGFSWGRRYRYAGYYSYMLLCCSLSIWFLMNVFFCLVPRYSAHLMIALGTILVATNSLYALLVPTDPLVIPFEGQNLTFVFGWHFWSLLGSGVLSWCIGIVLYIYILLSPDSYTTILDVDYDTVNIHNNERSLVTSTQQTTARVVSKRQER